MRASEAIVVLTTQGTTLNMGRDEIYERLSGGMQSAETIDFGHDFDGTWKIVRTRHEYDDKAEMAAKEIK